MAWRDLTGPATTVADSPAESRRFGRTIGRVTVGTDAAGGAELAEALDDATTDVLVVRYPADRLDLAAVVAASGRDVLPAGALTYWEAPSDAVHRPEPGPLRVQPAAERSASADLADVADVVDEVVAASFTGYGNHYLADPLLDPDAALAGYQEWARGGLSRDPGLVLLLLDGDTVIGLATCAADPDGSDLEILLAGLVPAAQGGGRYAHLLAGCADLALGRGLSRTIISTQVHNVRVQRAWARAGLRPFAAVETVHCVRRGLLG